MFIKDLLVNARCYKTSEIMCACRRFFNASSIRNFSIKQEPQKDTAQIPNTTVSAAKAKMGKPILVYENKSTRFYGAMSWAGFSMIIFWTVNAQIAVRFHVNFNLFSYIIYDIII